MHEVTPVGDIDASIRVRSQRSLRVAVADDETVMLEYFQATLSLLGHQVVVVAPSGRELVDQCQKTSPELIITDVKMPDMDGIEAVAKIARSSPTPVILVSAYHDADSLARANYEYILAYLVKPIKQADLETAISIAVSRFEQFHAYFVGADEQSRLNCTKEDDCTNARRRMKRINGIELEILKFIADGIPNKNIAVALNLSLRTIEKYRHSLFEGLGVDSAAEATRVWVLANLEH